MSAGRPGQAPAVRIDPVTAEVVRHYLRAVTEELETNLTRTAFSPLIYEYKDFAVGIVGVDGQLVAQGPGGLPIFLADIGGPLRSVVACHPLQTVEPGDALLTNDPGACGQHLNNVNMYTPVFVGGSPVAFIGVRAHWIDVGGAVPGSCFTNTSTAIQEEGVQFPALKLCRRGEFDRDVLRLVERNCRFTHMVMGDLRAQLAACRLGERRVLELSERFGWETIQAVIADSWERSERASRQRLAALPDGVYTAESWLDNDGVDLDRRVPIRAEVTIRGDEATVDLAGVADQLRGPYNSGYFGGGLTAAKVGYKYAVIPDLPADEGCFRPLRLELPPGKMLSADPTAPMARWNLPMSTVIDTVIRAFGGAAPANVAAGHHAAQNSYQLHGRGASGRIWEYHDTCHGGWGASSRGDGGGPFKTLSHGDCKDIPVEIVEASHPVRIESVELRTDSAGPGRYRGGMGTVRRCRTLEESRLTVVFERTSCPAWGLRGGLPAKPGRVTVEAPGRDPLVLTKATGHTLPPGTLITLETSGGGGYGDPGARERHLVAEDLRLGYISPEAAARDYGFAPDVGAPGGADDAGSRWPAHTKRHSSGKSANGQEPAGGAPNHNV